MALKQTKPALKSKTILGSVLSILGAVGSYLELAGKLPAGGAAPLVTIIGSVLAMFGRSTADIKPIKGLV